MRKKLVLYLTVFIILQFIKALCITDYKEEYGESRIEVILNKKGEISYEDMLLKEGYNQLQPIMLSIEEDIGVSGCDRATVIGATANWNELERLHMIDGAFFADQANRDERNLAVISDELAISMWGTEKAVGNIINIQEVQYQVVGVYKKYLRLREYILDDGSETIYIPLKSSVARDWKVQSIIIDGSKESPKVNELTSLGIDTSRVYINDATKWVKKIKGASSLPLIILWSGFSIVILKALVSSAKDKMKNKGYKLISILLGIVIIYITCKISFWGKFYIDPATLPAENIFEFSFYWKSLQQGWMRHSQFIGWRVSCFERALYMLKEVVYSLNVIQIVIIIKIILSYRKEIRF